MLRKDLFTVTNKYGIITDDYLHYIYIYIYLYKVYIYFI